MSQAATTLGGWAVAIERALESYDLEGKTLFEQAGIDLSLANDPNTRYPVPKLSCLMRLATDASQDPCFGLTVARFMRPTSWHALSFAIWASNTLKDGFERLARYMRMFTTCGCVELEEAEDSGILVAHVYPEYRSILQDEELDAFLASVVLTCRHLYRPDFHPQRITMRRPEPPKSDGFRRLFKCPLEFAAEQDAIYFEPEALNVPLPTANAELALHNEKIIADYLARLDQNNIIEQIHTKLIEVLPKGEPDMERIAASLHMSLRTLQRKLKECGTSYKQLLDEVRRQMACQYMQQSHLSIGEISYLLGFSNVSNFARAFKRWTGEAPGSYREKIRTAPKSIL